jgi:hypothetical protein
MKTVAIVGWYLLTLQDPSSSAPRKEAKPDFPSRDELKIVVLHDDRATCSDYLKTFRCSDVKHWVLSVNDVICANRARVMAFVKSEAERNPTPDPNHPTLSELKIKIFAESGAPYSEAGSIMTKCAKMGIYRVELGEKKTGGETDAITSALGVGTRSMINREDLVVLIGKQKPEKNDSVRWVEGSGFKEAIVDVSKHLGPREKLSIVLDPTESTPWTEVIQIIASLQRMGFERPEFAALRTVTDVQKK